MNLLESMAQGVISDPLKSAYQRAANVWGGKVGWVNGSHSYEYAFWAWLFKLYEWALVVSATHPAIEISRNTQHTHTPRL